jgi:hypothetical protein
MCQSLQVKENGDTGTLCNGYEVGITLCIILGEQNKKHFFFTPGKWESCIQGKAGMWWRPACGGYLITVIVSS